MTEARSEVRRWQVLGEGPAWRPVAVLVLVTCIVLHLWSPNQQTYDASYLVVMWLASFVAWEGAARAPDGQRLIPRLVAYGLMANAVGELSYTQYLWQGSSPLTSVADIAFWLSYLSLLAAVYIAVVRSRDNGRWDIDALIDVLTIVVMSLVVFWNASVDQIISDTERTALVRSVLASYPLFDALLLALVARALASPRGRQAVGGWFAAGVGAWLVADIAQLLVPSGPTADARLDVGWMVGAALMTTSCWRRPTAGDGLAVVASSPRGSGLGKVTVAVLPMLAPPVLLIVNHVRARQVDPVDAFIGLTLLLSLAFVRTARLMRSERVARQELSTSRDLALEGSRAKSEFLATMSHEIRTPMNGVLGLTGLLLNTDLDERQRQYAEGVRNAGDALLSLINDILDFSKVEAGKLELEIIDFDLVQVVEEAAEIVAPEARRKELELIVFCSPDVPTILESDPSRLRQVLINLVGNAIKFTDSGEVVLRVHVDERRREHAVLRFEVSDTGVGLEAEQTAQLFEPFTQADSTTTRRFGGTGLGLTICRQLVTALGGEIGVESEPGQGATFWFTLPVRVLETPGPVVPESSLAGLRVLAVDDNQTNLLILSEQLRAWEVEVETATEGFAAIRVATEAAIAGRPYDVCVLDMCMPGIDGLELARRLTAHPQLPDTGLVILTSAPDLDADNARDVGVSAVLSKPVHLAKLRRALANAARSAPLPTPPAARTAEPVGWIPRAARTEPQTDRLVTAPSAAPTPPAAQILPSAPPAPTPPVAPIVPAAPAAPEPVAAPSAGKGHILVVEDSATNQLVAVGMLEHLGYTVEIAGNGREALHALAARTFDAVLMDCRMPEMDGYEATRELRRRETNGTHTPVIALTANVIEGDAELCRDAGMDDFLPKPVSLRSLEQTLARWTPSAR